MKRTLIILALLLCMLGMAQAKPILGIRGGLSLATVHYIRPELEDPEAEEVEIALNNLPGFHGGLVVYNRVGEKLIIQPELLYSQKGYIQNAVLVGPVEIILDCIEFPVGLKYEFKYRDLKLQPLVAPKISYLIRSRGKAGGQYLDTKNLESLYGGIDLGMDIQTSDYLMIGARYEVGFTRINIFEEDEPEEDQFQLFNRGLHFSLTYLF